MKLIRLLTLLIKIFFYLVSAGLIGNLFMILIAIDDNDLSYLEYSLSDQLTPLMITIIILRFLSRIIFFYGVFHLIKVLKFEEFEDTFSKQTALRFKKAGAFMIVFFSLNAILNGLDYLFVDFQYLIKYSYSIMSFQYFSGIIGLFFIIFSQIMLKATEMKQENELTI